MSNTDLAYRVKELADSVNMMKLKIEEMQTQQQENEMWDNNDMMRNWKVSLRTLATWRSEGKICYIKNSGKILYSRENRDSFLLKNTISTN